MPRLNVADWVDCTEVEGPGKRFALWVQGCNIKCKNCCNQEMLPFVAKHVYDSLYVVDMVKEAAINNHIEGVTFLGGEPFLQARGLSTVAEAVQGIGLSVVVFSGFTLKQLQSESLPGSRELLTFTDVLVDGPYIHSRPDHERNWIGSTNQQFHFLTSKYGVEIMHRKEFACGMEVRLRADGTAQVNGHPVAIDALRHLGTNNIADM